MSDTVVLLVGNASTAGLALLADTVREHGLRVAVLTAADASPAVRAFGAGADALAYVDNPYDPGAVADAAVRLAGGVPAALVSWHDGTIVAAARAADRLGLARTDWRALARARNKYATRRALRAAGLPTPRFALIGDPADAGRVAEEVGLPAIVKPLSGTASSLVHRVDTVAELAGASRDIAERLPRLLGDMYAHPVADPDGGAPLDQSRTFLVEGLLDGPEVCIDVVVRDGAVEHLLMLENTLTDEHFFGRAFTLPPLRLAADRYEPVRQAVDDAIGALGIDNTLVHTEVIDDRRFGPTVVEVNAGRGGGGLVGLLVTANTGADLREEYLALALGRPAPARRGDRMPPPLASLNFYPPDAGRLAGLDGLAEVEAHPDVVVVRAPAVDEVTSGAYQSARLAVMVYGLDTEADLRAVYAEIEALLTWRITPAVPAGAS